MIVFKMFTEILKFIISIIGISYALTLISKPSTFYVIIGLLLLIMCLSMIIVGLIYLYKNIKNDRV